MAKTALAFDFGMRSIGVAFGQSVTQTANELKPLKAQDGIPNWDHIQQLINEWQPECFVVGEPFNMDDSESELTHLARKFANRIKERFSLPVYMIDERLSSVAAKEIAMERRESLDPNKNRVDSIAARVILESWLRQLHK